MVHEYHPPVGTAAKGGALAVIPCLLEARRVSGCAAQKMGALCEDCPKCDALVAGWAGVKAVVTSHSECHHVGCAMAKLIEDGYTFNGYAMRLQRDILKDRWGLGKYTAQLAGREQLKGKSSAAKVGSRVSKKKPLSKAPKVSGKVSNADGKSGSKGGSGSSSEEEKPLSWRVNALGKRSRLDAPPPPPPPPPPRQLFSIGQVVRSFFHVEEGEPDQAFIGMVQQHNNISGLYEVYFEDGQTLDDMIGSELEDWTQFATAVQVRALRLYHPPPSTALISTALSVFSCLVQVEALRSKQLATTSRQAASRKHGKKRDRCELPSTVLYCPPPLLPSAATALRLYCPRRCCPSLPSPLPSTALHLYCPCLPSHCRHCPLLPCPPLGLA